MLIVTTRGGVQVAPVPATPTEVFITSGCPHKNIQKFTVDLTQAQLAGTHTFVHPGGWGRIGYSAFLTLAEAEADAEKRLLIEVGKLNKRVARLEKRKGRMAPK